MRNVFVQTQNVQTFGQVLDEARGVEEGQPGLFEVTGRAGRGKTETAKRFCAQNPDTIYVSYIGTWTPMSMLSDICWELAAVKPGKSTAAIEVINETMQAERKVIMVDEADRLSPKLLDLLRDVNGMTAASIVLIGEENLSGKLARARRLASRVRRKVRFEPIGQPDLSQLYKQGMDVKVEPDALATLSRACEGDFRPALVDAYAVERILRDNHMDRVTLEVANAAVAQRNGGAA